MPIHANALVIIEAVTISAVHGAPEKQIRWHVEIRADSRASGAKYAQPATLMRIHANKTSTMENKMQCTGTALAMVRDDQVTKICKARQNSDAQHEPDSDECHAWAAFP